MTFTLGTPWIPGVAATGQDDASKMVDLALASGVNFFDTADGYSGGDAETALGVAFKGRRADAVICTKIGFRQSDRLTDAGLSRAHITASVDGCLDRLGTDYIDLLVLHKTDFTTTFEETARTLDDVVRAGKVRYVGCSNWPAWMAAEAVTFQRTNGLAPFVAGQYLYNAVNRDIEVDVLPMGAKLGVGLMAWSPLAGGLLTGKYDPADPSTASGRLSESNLLQVAPSTATAVIDALKEIAAAHDATPAQIALAWILAKDRSHSVIVGANSVSQREGSLNAAGITLRGDEVAAIDAGAGPDRRYPEWFDQMMTDETFTKALS